MAAIDQSTERPFCGPLWVSIRSTIDQGVIDLYNEGDMEAFDSYVETLPDDEQEAIHEWVNKEQDNHYLLFLELQGLYDELTGRLEKGLIVDNYHMLELLKGLGRPRSPTQGPQDKIDTFNKILPRIHFRAQYDTSGKNRDAPKLLNEGKKPAAIIKEFLRELAELKDSELNSWEKTLVSVFKDVDAEGNVTIDDLDLEATYRNIHTAARRLGTPVPKCKK